MKFEPAKILFGGFGPRGGGWRHGGPGFGGRHGGPMMWRAKMQAYMNNMTPEERAAFKEKMNKRCGGRYVDWMDNEPKNQPEATPQA